MFEPITDHGIDPVIFDQVSLSVSYTVSPFGKVLTAFLGFTVAGLRLPSLTHLDDVFVSHLPHDF